MANLIKTECCGIRELDGVASSSSARECVIDAAEKWHEEDMDGAFIYFSTVHTDRGAEVGAYIRKYKLGVVTKMRPTLNPNSDNMLSMWVWTVNKKNFLAYWHKTNRYKENYKSEDN